MQGCINMDIKKKEFKELQHLERAGEIATRILSSHIFNYIGGGETIEQLKQSVVDIVSAEELERLEHTYILRDNLGVTGGIMEELRYDNIIEDDTDTLIIRD